MSPHDMMGLIRDLNEMSLSKFNRCGPVSRHSFKKMVLLLALGDAS